MQHKPKFNTLITPCCMILKFWILLVQHICPLDHSINIAGRETVFIINTPYLPFRNLILTYILFSLSDYPHRLSLAAFNFNQNHISINGIIFNIPFESLKIFRFRCLSLAENIVAKFFLFQIFLPPFLLPVILLFPFSFSHSPSPNLLFF